MGNGFSKTDLVVLPKEVCLPIVLAAMEVFPKECMGMVSLGEHHGKVVVANFSFPYQLAIRKIGRASYIGPKLDATRKLANFHSHARRSMSKTDLDKLGLLGMGRLSKTDLDQIWGWPSDDDLCGMNCGDIEIIVDIARHKVRAARLDIQDHNGDLNGIAGRFRFSIRAFIKIGNTSSYRRIPLAMTKRD